MKRRPTLNSVDACCRCGELKKTAKDLDKPGPDELRVLEPLEAGAVSQWICSKCEKEISE